MDQALLVDLYELTMAQSYFIYQPRAQATFDLFVRALPEKRNYLIACGLTDVLEYLRNLAFSREDIAYLRTLNLFSEEFLTYVRSFRFSGEVWAVREGEVVFAGEPIIRITAPLIEAQIVESFLLNTINLQTMIASKASRVVQAAQGRGVFDFSLRRTHGAEAGIKVARASYLAGCNGTSNCLAGKLYRIPVAGTMAHAFVMSFKNEMSSFLAYCETFPEKTILLVDTYDTAKGIENAVTIGLYLKEKKHKLLGIRLDSGDIVALSRLARKKLDAAGLSGVQIFASGDLDEFKIKKLLAQGARVDNFGVGTNMGTSFDAPCLDVIYKLSEVTDESGEFLPTMKLSKGKVTYPGRKQIFRIQDRKGRFVKDIIGLQQEKIEGKSLLVKVVEKGKSVGRPQAIEEIRAYSRRTLLRFSGHLRAIDQRYTYPVLISPDLRRLQQSLTAQFSRRQ